MSQKNLINEFLQSFGLKKQEILKGLENLSQNSEENEKILASNVELLQELKKFFSDSVSFLPSYEIKQCQKTLEALETEISNCRTKFVPKKKFSFKSKPLQTLQISQSPSTFNPNQLETPQKLQTSLLNETKDENSETSCLSISNKSNETFHLERNTLEGSVFKASDFLSTLHLFHLKNCKVFSGPITGSVLLENCEDCLFVIASQQIRIHNSKNCTFYLFSKSNPIIENSSQLRFGPYTLNYPTLKAQFQQVNFDIEKNCYSHVEDFNWLKSQKSPHWELIPEDQIQYFH